jgi:hypothetical protein
VWKNIIKVYLKEIKDPVVGFYEQNNNGTHISIKGRNVLTR